MLEIMLFVKLNNNLSKQKAKTLNAIDKNLLKLSPAVLQTLRLKKD